MRFDCRANCLISLQQFHVPAYGTCQYITVKRRKPLLINLSSFKENFEPSMTKMAKSFLLGQERERNFFVYNVVTDQPLENYWGGLGASSHKFVFSSIALSVGGGEGKGGGGGVKSSA